MIHKISAVLFSILAFFSCTAPIDIHTRDSKPVLVVYGCLTDVSTLQHIRLTASSPFFDNAPNAAIMNAKVSVRASSGREYSFVSEKDGYYVSNRQFSVIPGVTYYLSVEVDFDGDGITEVYEAETTTLPIVPIDSIDITTLNIMGYRHFSLNLYMQEPSETENYYLFKYFINDSISNDMVSEFLISNDLMFNGEYLDGVNITYFEDFSDPKIVELFRNNENALKVYPGDRLQLQILNIEKCYFNFIRECMNEKYGENPFFGGPPSNITTNLSNGAIGYFTSFCIQEAETCFPYSND